MKQDPSEKLSFIVEKYKRLPDARFLLYETYIDQGYDSMGLPVISYFFEIRKYTREAAETSMLDEAAGTITGVDENRVGVAGLASVERGDKKYAIANGIQIAQRAEGLRKLLECHYLQPPGSMQKGIQHFGFDIKKITLSDSPPGVGELIDCRRLHTCASDVGCPPHKRHKISGLRYSGNRGSDTRVLQSILFKFGYGDEMRYEKYETDGIYGKRTRLAVSNFIRELNDIENKAFKPSDGNYISSSFAREIKFRCEQGWERERYYLFTDPAWNLKVGLQENELSWLKRRHHVRQLQEDLQYLTITRMDYLPHSDIENPIDVNIEEHWVEGRYDSWTEIAVTQFQEAALAGARFEPVHEALAYPLSEPTYKGDITGVVDTETKREIQRWFEFVESAVEVKDLYIKDVAVPELENLDLQIISPMLTCAALTTEGGSVDILLAVPVEVSGVQINTENLKQSLPYFLFLHKPVYADKPFMYDNYTPSYKLETRYTVIDVAEITENGHYRFYRGTRDAVGPAEFLDSSDESRLKVDDAGNTIAAFSDRIKNKMQQVYDRKYPGLGQIINTGSRKIWLATLQLSDSIREGIYLFKARGSSDLKPHPVRVFDRDKSAFNCVHLTDLHLATRYDELTECIDFSKTKYNNPNDRLRDFIVNIKNGVINADFIVITGDVVDHANHHRPYDSQDGKYIFKPVMNTDANWRLLHYLITTDPGIDVPLYICLGNHDFKPNPAPLHHLLEELNIGAQDAACYLHDINDIDKWRQIINQWNKAKCYGDVLYADENAAQYYFENFCPFTDFNIRIKGLNFIFMNTGHESQIFSNEFGAQQVESELARRLGRNPAPASVGFNTDQLNWINQTVSDNAEKTNILCMHNPLINTTQKVLIDQGMDDGLVEEEITDARDDYDESSIVNGRSQILDFIEKGQIKLALTGHTHRSQEFRCERGNGTTRWFAGNYSSVEQGLEPINDAVSSLIVSTVSAGMTGIEITYNHDSETTEKHFTGTGYRKIEITSAGLINRFSDRELWLADEEN